MSHAPGVRLGTYEILSPLGAGGMGEVYRARDTKLGREVAVKVLPQAFAANPDRVARFAREAHLLASLNHPNIAAIHGVEDCDGARFLVLELVAGETLAERFAKGPLPLKEALELFRQLAEALENAHDKGIIHRDLKPSNIKVTPEGKLKVLDFGLAKAFASEPSNPDLSQSPTLSVSGTDSGVILGTAPYMSPEQARGKLVDKRTDVWAAGCVLYEALSGRRAFEGETVSDTIARILEREPEWEALPPSTPGRIRDLVRRCLQKDLHRRLHDIADARIEIEEALAEPVSLGARAARVERRGAALALVIAAAVAGGLLLDRWLLRGRPGSSGGPELTGVARLTHDLGVSEAPTWSPDGSLLAFASNRSGNFEIYVRRIQGGEDVNITDDPGQDIQPAFSPDGNWIAFVSTRSSRTGMIKIGATFGFEFRTYGGDLWVAPALGGRARRVARDANFPAWHPSGRKIAFVSGPESHRSILEVDVEGGAPRPILPAESSSSELVRVQYSPGGSWMSFATHLPEKILVVPTAGGVPRELFDGSSHVWEGSGRIYYLRRDPAGGTRLRFIEVDEGTAQVRGAPHTVGLMTGILRDLAVSFDGRRLAVSELEGSLNLTRLPLAPGGAPAGPEEILSSGHVIDRYPAFSPDGKSIAFASDRLGREEIWILDLVRRRQERLGLPGEDLGVNLPYWAPDGQQLVVTRFYENGSRSLWLAAADGSHAEQIWPPEAGLEGGPFSPDGRTLLFVTKRGQALQLMAFDVASRRTRQLSTSPGDKYSPAWSPDGRFVAYASSAGGATLQLWRMRAEGGEAQSLTTSDERMRHAFYSPDGRFLYIQPSHRNVYRLPASGGPLTAVTTFPEGGLFLEEPTLSPDGRYLAYCRSNGGSSLWVLTLE